MTRRTPTMRDRPAPRRRTTQPAPARSATPSDPTRSAGSRRASQREMDRRIRARRAAVRRAQRRRQRRRMASLAALLAVAALGIAVVRSPLFAIAEIQVTGITGDPAAQIRDVVGVREGANLLDADLAAAQRRVSALPWVAGARVDQIPPSTVVVEVTPRPAAAVLRTDDAAWVLGPDGVLIDGGEREGVPVVVAGDRPVPPLGEPMDDPGVRAVLAIIADLPGDLADRVVGYRLDGEQVVATLDTADVLEQPELDVAFGSADRLEDKGAVVRAMIDVIADSGTDPEEPVILDVRAPDNPVVR